MKILFINRVMGLWRGGGETFDLNIARELQKKGCEIEFITSKPRKGLPPYPIREFNTNYIYSPYLQNIPRKLPFKVKGLGKLWIPDMWLWGKKVIKYLKKYDNNYDVAWISANPVLATDIMRYLNMPTILTLPGPPDRLWFNSVRKLPVVVANGDAYKFIVKNISKKNAIYINLGVNFSEGNSQKIRLEYGIETSEKIILFVGRLIKIKNISFLIKGFKKVLGEYKKVKLLIVGVGPEKNKLLRLANNFKINDKIIFTDFIAHDEIKNLYSAADIFALTSKYDNFPNVILEAMRYGLPVVATNVGGIPLQVENNLSGYLIEPNNIEQLKNALLKLLKDEELRKEMGLRNKEKVICEYSWERSARELLGIYKSLLGRKN